MIVVVMGVSGSGKSTLGRALARSLGWQFVEGDDYHPTSNIEKMRSGIPLSEDDRRPWLLRLREVVASIAEEGGSAVVTCSALRRTYRDLLTGGVKDTRFVLLCGDPQLIRNRLSCREHHFMPPELFGSQVAALEPPGDALLVPVQLSTAEQVALVLRNIGEH